MALDETRRELLERRDLFWFLTIAIDRGGTFLAHIGLTQRRLYQFIVDSADNSPIRDKGVAALTLTGMNEVFGRGGLLLSRKCRTRRVTLDVHLFYFTALKYS